MNQLSSHDEQYFGTYFPSKDRKPKKLPPDEERVCKACVDYVSSRFTRMKYILGLGMDFVLLAQQICRLDSSLSKFEPSLTEAELFQRYRKIEIRGGTVANTLTLTYGEAQFGIRKLEEHVLSYFYSQYKMGYPSAYVYNTGQWHKYKDLLVDVFRLSASGRFKLLKQLLAFGNERIESITIKTLRAKGHDVFERILANYGRSVQEENGGLAFQAMAFGFVSETYGHLNVVADKVRTGSARQKRIGDIDAYFGDELAVTFEVKDVPITADNFAGEAQEFVNKANSLGVLGIVICQSIDEASSLSLAGTTVRVLPQERLRDLIRLWDPKKQERAVAAMRHYLANIEHNESAVRRLNSFVLNYVNSEKSSD